MNNETESSDDEKFIEETKLKQRNTVWPHTLLNGRSVDEFLWKGSPEASPVKRIGAFIFGITYMLGGLGLIEADRESAPDRRSLALVIIGVAFILVGLKVFFNAFRRHKSRGGSVSEHGEPTARHGNRATRRGETSSNK
jgi:hypothetical protein